LGHTSAFTFQGYASALPAALGRAMRGWAILGVWLLCSGCGQVADAQTSLMSTLRVKAAIGDYGKSTGTLDRCVKARLVAAAYSDARDVPETQAWRAREQVDCREAAAAMHATAPGGAAKP
jgi:hypothetical protein